ncbi:hypothetical protein CAL7716_036880 [Calothrix sp. PCC 7716]|nr:hypothetical protein CAL7716_036880 [Calothrix sp. PCC 7716]
MQKLNLNSEQTEKIQTIQQQYEVDLEKLSPELKLRSQTLTKMLEGDAKSAEISKQQSQVSKLQKKISELEFDRYLAIRDVLTVEQRRRRYYLRKDPSN